MPRSISELVADNFSKDPEYYDRAADAQKKAAELLADAIRSAAESAFQRSPKRVLEIGCGTGFLTGRLFELFPDAEFAATDISPAMLEFCRRATEQRRTEKGVSAEFALDDISATRLEGDFDLVASSFAFQWAGRMTELVPTLARLTRPGGLLCFSALREGTFAEVRSFFAGRGVPFPIPHLASDDELRGALSAFRNVEIRETVIEEKHASLREFLRHLQKVGAVNASGERVSTADLRRVLAEDAGEKLTVEYDVAIVTAERGK